MHNKSMAAAVFLLAAGFAFPAHAQSKLTHAQCVDEVMGELARQGIDERSIPTETLVTPNKMTFAFSGGVGPESLCKIVLPHIEEHHDFERKIAKERDLKDKAIGEKDEAIKALDELREDPVFRDAHLNALIVDVGTLALLVAITWFLLNSHIKKRRRSQRFMSSRSHSGFIPSPSSK